ncbi:Uncharacterised protein [uncultured archaeon]|nr:Uncharacterised protein [uncultured archaeon]
MDRHWILMMVVLASAALLLAGCTGTPSAPAKNESMTGNNSQAGRGPGASASAPVCGNGKLEKGETAATCCRDAGCPSSQQCVNSGGVYACAKLAKEDTNASKQIARIYQQARADWAGWLASNSSQTAGADAVREELGAMAAPIAQLQADGYDVSAEQFLMEAQNQTWAEMAPVAAAQNGAMRRVEEGRGSTRERYLNALNLSLMDLDQAAYEAGVGQTRADQLRGRQAAAWQAAVEQYGMPEDELLSAFSSRKTEIQDSAGRLKAEQARLGPHNQNEWVQSGDLKIRVGGLARAGCSRDEHGGWASYLVVPIDVQNTGDGEVAFGPSALRVRDWYKNQYASATPYANSTSEDCVKYYHDGLGLANQSLLPGSRMSGQVWMDVNNSMNAYPWEIYVDVPGGEQVLYKISLG